MGIPCYVHTKLLNLKHLNFVIYVTIGQLKGWK